MRYLESVKLLEVAKAQSAWGSYLDIEAGVLTTYYRSPLIGGGYRAIMGGLLTYLGNHTQEKLKAEYAEAMKTCD